MERSKHQNQYAMAAGLHRILIERQAVAECPSHSLRCGTVTD